MSDTKSRTHRVLTIAAVLVLGGAISGVAYVRRYGFPARAAGEPAGPAILSIVVSGDTAGWLVPCGCTTNQSGGLLRRGTLVRQLESRGPLLVVDAGGAAAGTSAYHKLKFEAILQGELAMNLAAHNLGASEVAFEPDYLREVAYRLHVPFVSANVRDKSGITLAEPIRIVEHDLARIGVTGVLSRRFAHDQWQVDEPRDALLKVIAANKSRYDVLLVLAYLPEEELRQLAAALPEADLIIGGPTGQAIAPQPVGSTLVASATNKGKFLVHLETEGPRGRPAWSGKIVELNESFADDAQQQANVRRYLASLDRRDIPAAEAGFAAMLPVGLPRDYRLAGNDACISCHKNDCTLWSGSKHGHAWQTLQGKGYHVDSYCQQCHTTGYGLPGGFESARRSAALTNVGCESCHGPSAAHVRSVKTKTPFAAKDQCDRCHDRENSPQFDYPVYWPKIKHGEPATTGG